MQNILSKYSILYLTNHNNRSAHKNYFSSPKGVTWEAVLNVQDWPTVPPPSPPFVVKDYEKGPFLFLTPSLSYNSTLSMTVISTLCL